MKKTNTVKLILDSKSAAIFTEEQKKRLSKLSEMSDEEIDTSDAPCNPNALWMKAANKVAPTKKQITLRVDSEIIDFFKSGGKRYQSRINAILRSYMAAQKTQ